MMGTDSRSFDVAVIGGGPAGLATAIAARSATSRGRSVPLKPAGAMRIVWVMVGINGRRDGVTALHASQPAARRGKRGTPAVEGDFVTHCGTIFYGEPASGTGLAKRLGQAGAFASDTGARSGDRRAPRG